VGIEIGGYKNKDTSPKSRISVGYISDTLWILEHNSPLSDMFWRGAGQPGEQEERGGAGVGQEQQNWSSTM
jgi:hypothetical protein